MDKNQPFFDPYNFSSNMQQTPNMQPQPQPDINMQDIANPSMYYEQQYMYYRYLTQVLEYKTKLREWERLNRESSK